MLSHSCIPGINSVGHDDLYTHTHTHSIFVKSFAWDLMRCVVALLYFFFFPIITLFWFRYQDNSGLIEWTGKCFLLFCFLENTGYNWHYFFIRYLVEFTKIATWAGIFFVLNANSISLRDIRLFWLSFFFLILSEL